MRIIKKEMREIQEIKGKEKEKKKKDLHNIACHIYHDTPGSRAGCMGDQVPVLPAVNPPNIILFCIIIY